MMKHVVSAGIFALALALASPVWGQAAQGVRGGRGAGLEAQEEGGPGERGGGARGGPQLTQAQSAAIRSMNEASAPLDQAINEARNALNAAIYTDKPDLADIRAKVDKLAAAELARANARAEAFAKLQASPNKLTLPPEQIMMIMRGPGGGGRGGFGGRGGGGRGGAGGGQGADPGGAGNRPPPTGN